MEVGLVIERRPSVNGREKGGPAASISTPRERSMTETIVSGIAGTLTTAAFVPQAYKIIQSRKTAGVSLWMHVILLWAWHFGSCSES
jgi:hypothetical protein